MENEEDNAQKEYIEGIVKTALPLIFGAAGGIISYLTDPSNPKNDLGWLILGAVIIAQTPVYSRLSIDINAFRFKDWFYLTFMTFLGWFITWAMILMSFTP